MKKILNEELDRAFHNRRFFIILILALVIFIIGTYRSPVPAFSQDVRVHPVNRLMLNLYYGEFGFLAALLATLPFTDSFQEDYNQGFLRLIVQRVSFHKYLKAKVLIVALTGGISLLLTVLIVFLAGLSSPVNWNIISGSTSSSFLLDIPQGPLGFLYTLNPFLYLLYLLVSVFGFGAGCALLGLAISTFIRNRYVILAAPLVFVQVLSFLEQRALHLTPALNPLYSLLPFTAYSYEGNFALGSQLAQFGFVMVISLFGFLFLTQKSRAAL